MAGEKIGIDIGHGKNTYNTGGGKGVKKGGVVYEEHDFNSAVARILDKRLKAHGFKTYMAQPPNANDVALKTRTDKYNAEKCSIVVSIHANAGVDTANGACAFYWHTSSAGRKLSDAFMKHWKSTVKGVKQFGTGSIASVPNTWTNFHICRETDMVAILVEAGFMTNANDFNYIFGSKKNTYIPQVAEAIVKAVCEYHKVKYKPEVKAAPKPSPAPSGTTSHKVVKGDTLWAIANKYGVTVSQLRTANPKVDVDALQIGSTLKIPVKSHKIVKGDTFYSLAEKYKTTVTALKKANPKVDPNELQIGQTIMIP